MNEFNYDNEISFLWQLSMADAHFSHFQKVCL